LTLVEMLVVLALIGVVAGAVGLSLGPAVRGPGAPDEARLLAARMHRASEEALLTGQPVALVWTERDYRFLTLGAEGWAPHSVPLLAQVKALPPALRFAGSGAFAVTGANLPAGGARLELSLEGSGPAAVVTWDGVTAALVETSP
jgi:general secretion pathway protein H